MTKKASKILEKTAMSADYLMRKGGLARRAYFLEKNLLKRMKYLRQHKLFTSAGIQKKLNEGMIR